MKKILFIFIGILLCGNNCFAYADCSKVDSAILNMHKTYFDNNKNRQIDGEIWDNLDVQGKRVAKLRNLCFNASIDWHRWCGLSYCEACEGNGKEKKCRHVDPNEEAMYGRSWAEMCTLSEIDCFTEDIDKIYSILKTEQDPTIKMFGLDMNVVVKDVLDGKSDIHVIDGNKSVCYETDDNGDTIWHAFARSNRDAFNYMELCASVIKDMDPFDVLSNALYKIKNKQGKTAMQEAINSETPDNIFGFFRLYARQEHPFELCDFIAQDISKTNNIDIAMVKSLLKCP